MLGSMRRVLGLSILLACHPTSGTGEKQALASAGDGPPATSTVTATPTPTPTPTGPTFTRDDRTAVQAALRSAGVELDDHDCVTWPASFPRVVVVGSFAHDRGCRNSGLFVDRKWIAEGGEVEALATRDFVGAKLTDKEAIARAWIDEVEHAFGGEFVATSEVAFTLEGSRPFTPVVVRENKVGGVVVEGWERVPPGMRDQSTYVLVSYRFAPDGQLTAETKQDFSIEGQRLRDAEEAARKKPRVPPPT